MDESCVGKRCRYYPRVGSFEYGVIEGFEPEGKNGCDVVDVVLDNGEHKWGYTDQVQVL